MKLKFTAILLFLFIFAVFAVSCSENSAYESSTAETAAESIVSTTSASTDSPQTSTEVSTTETTIESTVFPITETTVISTEKTPETTEVPMVHTISPQEAKNMIDQGNVIIVDVRRADEYAEGHIPNAILVPNETILTEALEALPDTDAVILVYCRSGRRSAEASQKLVSLGYRQVYDFGGILDWPYDTTK